jgi:hypothetical protein
MNSRDDGGPAFPSGYNMDTSEGGCRPAGEPRYGLSLRDYFAAAALPAVIAAADKDSGPSPSDASLITATALVAYLIADAMLEERSK